MIILLPMLLSLFFGICIGTIPFKKDEVIANFALVASIFISCSAFAAYGTAFGEQIVVMPAGYDLTIAFHIDGMTVAFGGLVSLLWPIAIYYAKTYMTHEGGFQRFFTFYILTFGVVLGLASSENMFTLYLFYELLTFITMPLVAHNQDSKALYAGKVYVSHMIFGASLSFAGMMIFLSNMGEFHFVLGGMTPDPLSSQMLVAYVLMFVGFGTKAGLVPLHGWLLGAGVAPTTVTALLHAVAVVKSGAFATMRLTYCLYTPEMLQNTFAQWFVMSIVIVSVMYGSFSAVKAQHLKRRLAYSTVSQLSYILLAVSTMSMLGLRAAFLHMFFHAFCKIVLFYGAGNLLFSNHAEYLQDMKGWGRKLNGTFLPMTICGLGLIGVPPFGPFFSKYGIIKSLASVEIFGVFGIIAVAISAFFTAIYIFQLLVTVYLPEKGYVNPHQPKSVPVSMERVLQVLTVAMIVLSLVSGEIENLLLDLLKVGGV